MPSHGVPGTATVRAVTLDLDGTLCRYRESAATLLDRAFRTVGVDPLFTAAEYRERRHRYLDGTDTRAELREACFADMAEHRGHDPAVGRRVAAAYGGLREHGDVEPLPGALAAVDRLAEEYPLALVTNGPPEIQAPKLATLGLDDAFDDRVHAGYDTLAKPDPAPFIDAVSALGVPPASVVHVGNSVHADVWGADAAGMQTALLDGEEADHTRPHYRLASMADLVDPPWG
jgi:putative hydrolase of the HAD superfamily